MDEKFAEEFRKLYPNIVGRWTIAALIDPEAWGLNRNGRTVVEFHKSRWNQVKPICELLNKVQVKCE